jgi:hypothetical protein
VDEDYVIESEASSSNLVLAYVLLAHESASHINSLVETLLSADPTARVVIHYDLNASPEQYAALEKAFALHDRAWLVKDRVRCAWGRFGLVDGVVRALRVLRDHKVECDYVYLLSGSCMPTKPLAKLKRFLAEHRGMEFIEAHTADWMVGGLREERYEYRHWFSYQTQKPLFEAFWRIQRFLHLKRKMPKRLIPRFGSQWWCLTSETCFAILDFIDRNGGAYGFFKSVCIPDELFFQTMVWKIATPARVVGKNLTFFKFTWKGRPVTFYDDHIDLVPELPGFFSRKISLLASGLRQRLAEIAAAPDDGEDFPSLETKSEVFDYGKRVRAQNSHPLPGQLFFGGQMYNGWPSSLANVRKPFVVLHGPPAVTRIVAEHLRGVPGLTLLGRVFSPKSIQFEPLGEAYAGFEPEDALIRDMDPPLYLSRLLERADGLPIIEVSPGDTPHGEGYFYYSDSVIFISCQPNAPVEESNRRLYWALSSVANPESKNDDLLDWDENSSLQDVPKYADALIEKFTPTEHRKWLTDKLLVTAQERPIVRLVWGDGRRATTGESAMRQLTLLQDRIGPALRPLIRAMSGVDARMAGIRPIEITGDLPAEWRVHFSSGAGQSYDSWAAAFDQTSVGYAVLYGPPALTGILSEHLNGVPGVTTLGRVFEPRNPLVEAAADGDAQTSQEALMLRERDRPLYLRQLLAGAEGFPVIEVCPGDEPVGEGYLISHPNVVVISCEPNLLDDEGNLCLYWALAAASNPLGADDSLRDLSSRGNSLRAREFIDAFVEKYTPRGHREWLNKTILDNLWFHTRAGKERKNEFVRLFWGAAQDKDGAEFRLGKAEPPLRILGQTSGPLVEALTAMRAKFATGRIEAITATLPESWREYFSLLKPEAVVAPDWAAALQESSVGFAVLHGPPAVTRVVREHLAQSPDITLLGRVFDPAAASELAEQDRPNFLTQLLAGAKGFPVVEICPGDDPVGEMRLLEDENALFISCQTDHANAEDRNRLYWSLTAAADPASVQAIEAGNRAHASLLRVRHEIDGFVEAFTPTEHRLALTEALLGDSPPPQVLRLASGTGDRVANGEPLVAATARLRRTLGPAFNPLLKGLTDVDLKLAGARTLDLVAGFPSEWRDYFSTGDEPTFESWEAALGSSNSAYCVLYGPPAATKFVHSHLAGLPGLKMLGRVFDPDASAGSPASPQAAKETLSRVEDRPAALAKAFAESEAMPIIEVCPGDDRHGEEFFVSDPKAVILSCEPADPEDADDAALYWALIATGSKAARHALAATPVAGDNDASRKALEAFVATRILPAHREWFSEAVLFPEHDDRIVRLPWTGLGSIGGSPDWQNDEPLPARLARLRDTMGPEVAPVAEALWNVQAALTKQSFESLVASLPVEWRPLFVTEFEAEEKVA